MEYVFAYNNVVVGEFRIFVCLLQELVVWEMEFIMEDEGKGLTLISDSTESDSDFEVVDDTSFLLEHKKSSCSPSLVKNGSANIGCIISLQSSADGDSRTIAPLISSPEESENLNVKKKTELCCCMAVTIICFLQAVAFPLQSLDALLLNVNGYELRNMVVITIYASFLISCLVTPAVIEVIGVKWTIFLGSTGPFIYAVVRMSPDPIVVVGGALYAGLTQGALLGAAGVLITHHAIQFSMFGGHNPADILGLFNGFFYTWFLFAPFINSMLRLLILPPEVILDYNQDPNVSDVSEGCGVEFCWKDSREEGDTNDSVNKHRMQALLGTHIVCTIGAWLITLLVLDKDTRWSASGYFTEKGRKDKSCSRFCSSLHLADTLVHMKDVQLALLITIMMYVGVQQVVGYQVVLRVRLSS